MSFFAVTGYPGSGKTTLVSRIVDRLDDDQAAGFITVEVREDGTRTGFDVVTLDGRRAPLARVGPGSPRVSKYAVDLPSFENTAVDALKQALRQPDVLLVIDEVGKMELLSEEFCQLLAGIMKHNRELLATAPQRSSDPLVQKLKHDPRTRLWQVKRSCFDRVEEELSCAVLDGIKSR